MLDSDFSFLTYDYNQIMLEQGKSLFTKFVKKIRNYEHFLEILDNQQSFIDYRRYNISQLTSQKALQTYERQLNKYSSNENLLLQTNKWQVFDKKLFVWFIIIYSYFLDKKTALIGPNSQIIHHIDFDLIAKIFFAKNSLFLKFQLYNVLNTNNKIVWTQIQDKYLNDAVRNSRNVKWQAISMDIFFATDGELFVKPKCCKERWINHFNQNIKKGNWEPRQDYLILEFVTEKHGKRWSMLREIFKNQRTEHSIKNRYKSLIQKNRKYSKQSETSIARKTLQNLRNTFLQQSCKQIQLQKKQVNQRNQIKLQTNQGFSSPQEVLSQNCQLIKQEPQQNHKEQCIFQLKKEEQNVLDQQAKRQEEQQQQSSSNDMIYPFSSFNYELQICNYNTQLYEMHNLFMLCQSNLALLFPYQPINAPYPYKKQS